MSIVVLKNGSSNTVSNTVSLSPDAKGGLVYAFGTFTGSNVRVEPIMAGVSFTLPELLFTAPGIANLYPGIKEVRSNQNLAVATTDVTIVIVERR